MDFQRIATQRTTAQRGSAREEFLCGRFIALSDSEQTLLLTRLLNYNPRAHHQPGAGPMAHAAQLFQKTDRQSRLDLFRQTLSIGSGLDAVSQSLLEMMTKRKT